MSGARKPAKTVRVISVSSGDTADAEARLPWLLVVHGADIDLGRHMVCDGPIVIGRDLDVDMPLHDNSISRAHCKIVPTQDGGFELVDLESTNGTRLNGRPLERPVRLREGDKVLVGESVIRFSYADRVDLQYHERREEMVSTDPLTGMSAKRVYDASFDTLVARASIDQSPLAVMVMDMDGLKQINDSHGHEMGGFTISEVATIIRAELDSHGILCRFGGDEFVGAFAGISRDQAAALAETVRERIASHTFVRDGIEVSPTISIGVAVFPDDVVHPRQLFAAADQALYRAKRAGRNRVEMVADWNVTVDTRPGDFRDEG